MRREKKAEIAGQVFIYLLTVIIMGLMFYFGINWVMDMKNTGDKINVIQLKVDLENSFDKMRSDFGSWKIVEYTIPSGIKKICFVEQQNSQKARGSGLCTSGNEDYDGDICDAWDGISEQNVFFSPRISQTINLKKITVDSSGYKCFDVQSGTLKMKITGLGDSVKIS